MGKLTTPVDAGGIAGWSLNCSQHDCDHDGYLDAIDLACFLVNWDNFELPATQLSWLLANWGVCLD